MTNHFRSGLSSGAPQIGLWMSLSSALSADALARVGYDWLLCDTEHAPIEVSGVLPILQAADTRTEVVVRVAWNDKVLIKRHLDQGARTLLVPFIENAEEARAAVSATRYPPEGVRGVAGATRASVFGLEPDYLRSANGGICLIVQVETRTAIENIEEIASEPGVDGVFIGPSDLAASLGYLGNPSHDDVQKTIKICLERIKSNRKPAGILATTEQMAKQYIKMGFNFVAVGVDMGLLISGAVDRLNKSRSI